MNRVQSPTAIVLFARRAEDEAIHKNLLLSKKKNLALHSKLVDRAKTVAREGNGEFIHFHEELQQGDTFGERITNCLSSVFNHGYSNVILVGGDSPELSVAHINEAVGGVQGNRFVLGEDQHGGAYLIGLTKKQFDSSTFQKLSWNTSDLFQDLRGYALKFGDCVSLEKSFDLNDVRDVVLFKSESSSLTKFLTLVFHQFFKNAEIKVAVAIQAIALIHSRRGPPVLS